MEKSVAQQRVSKAMVQLIIDEPFFATIALNMILEQDNEVKNFKSNGKYIKYNEKYVEKKSLSELKAILAHMTYRVALMHHIRRGSRDQDKWNLAGTCSVNLLLDNANFTLPEEAYKDEAYEDMSSERVYDELPEGQGGFTYEIVDAEGIDDESSRDNAEAEVKEMLNNAAMNASAAGKLPDNMKRLIDKLLEPKISWQEVLAAFLTQTNRNDYSFKKPNPRFASSGFFLPSLYSEDIGDIVLFVDTSGSINNEVLNKFASEMQGILSTFNKGFKVIYVDAAVHAPQDIEPDGLVDLSPAGGGGTDFRPGFEYLEQEKIEPACVIYFTDMECHSFPPAPEYPVLWVQYGHYENIPPFGDLIKLENK